MASAQVYGNTTFTLATYNIHVGVPMGQGIGSYKVTLADLDNIFKPLAEMQPDLVALQEVDCEYGIAIPHRRRSSAINEARYLAALGGYTYIYGSAQDDTHYPSDNAGYVEWGNTEIWRNNSKAHGEVGNALLSRWSLSSPPENIPLPMNEGQERRACIRATMDVPISGPTRSRAVVVYAAHLQHNSGSTRYEQMEAILDRVEMEAEGALVFVMGDLNHELDSKETSNPIQLCLDRGLHDLSEPPDGDKGFTFPANVPDLRIDFIFCNQPLKVQRRWTLPSQASDHLPLAVTVEVPM